MRRFAMDKLLDWKKKSNRKPLILMGARQVGKTWLMKEFGKTYYEKTAYISFTISENAGGFRYGFRYKTYYYEPQY